MDYYIKATDKVAFEKIMVDTGLLVVAPEEKLENGEVASPEQLVPAENIAISVIGVIQKPTGAKVEVEGVLLDEYAPVPGYHANLRGALSAEQEAALADCLIPQPANPSRVWF